MVYRVCRVAAAGQRVPHGRCEKSRQLAMMSTFDPAALASTLERCRGRRPARPRAQLTRQTIARFWSAGDVWTLPALGQADSGATYAPHEYEPAEAVDAETTAKTTAAVAASSAVLIEAEG